MNPDEFAADKALRIAQNTLDGANRLVALVASRPVDGPMLAEALAMAVEGDIANRRIMMEALDEPADPAIYVRTLIRAGNQTGRPAGSLLGRLNALAERRTGAVLVRERACPSTLLALLPEPEPERDAPQRR